MLASVPVSYLGYQSVTVRADSEPSCNALCESIKALRLKLGMQTRIEQEPTTQRVPLSVCASAPALFFMSSKRQLVQKLGPTTLCMGGHGDTRHGCCNGTVCNRVLQLGKECIRCVQRQGRQIWRMRVGASQDCDEGQTEVVTSIVAREDRRF